MFAKRWAKEKSVKNGKSAKLAAEVSRGGRQLFKTAKLPRYWQKSHALAEKFQARYNKNARIKMLAGEGKRANMGKTDPEKAIVIEGRRGKQTGNE